MRKVSSERVGKEVSAILAAALAIAVLVGVGSFLFSNWFIRLVEIAGLGWIIVRSWTIRDWISDLALDRAPAEPASNPITSAQPIRKEAPTIRLDSSKSDSKSKLKILLSSENTAFREKVSLILRKTVARTSSEEVEVLVASTARETLSLATDHVFHLVVLDAKYTGDLGFADLHTEIKRLDKSIPVVLLSDLNILPNVAVDGFYRYPFEVDGLKQLLAHLRRPTQTAEVRHNGNKLRHS